ncbi:MAG TPA: O-antigen translocase [Candidatus Acidoferrales bacterium]|nr:O-antigen translocase [Candidatus Acidoferrales bacterium]
MSSTPCNTPVSAPLLQPRSQTSKAAPAEKHTYGQILKSSALIGGSSVLKLGIGIVRNKAMAVLLGPSGIGLIGLYNSIIDLAQNIAGMGVNSSGVRQIAEAVGSGDNEKIARTAIVLRRTALVLGALGAALLVLFCQAVSGWTFGTSEHAAAIAWLALAVFFGAVAGGQTALIQGIRRIADLAKMGVLGAIYGTIIGVALVYFLGERGIVPSLIAVAGMSVLMSWWFSRKVEFKTPTLSVSQVRNETAGLLKLGFAFMASSLFIMGAAYVVRIFVVRNLGFDAAGLYQASWYLGVTYIWLILQAMGADFYPRLTATVKNPAECNRVVNEQAQVSLLLAGPGVIATMTFAPAIVALLYSAKFSAAVPLLRWICLGATLQVITWPMGYIIVAKARQSIFFWCEFAYTAVYVALAWVGIRHFALNGAGMAFFGSYVFHGLMIYPVVRWLTGFRWSAANRRTGLVFVGSIGLVFCSFYLLPFWASTAVGAVAALLSGIYSLRTLCQLVSLHRAPGFVQRLLVRCRLAPRDVEP